jgi:hypothetical protein
MFNQYKEKDFLLLYSVVSFATTNIFAINEHLGQCGIQSHKLQTWKMSVFEPFYPARLPVMNSTNMAGCRTSEVEQ